MINLRFHIVSIVAVFLALAIGILAGTTLLDQATVKVLRNNQRNLERRNDRLDRENESLRSSMNIADAATSSFGSAAMTGLLSARLDATPVLFLAVRGIDEDVVHASVAAVRDVGGAVVGTIWFDRRFDLDDPAALSAIEQAIGTARETNPATPRARALGAMTAGLATAAQATTTTTAPGSTAGTNPPNPIADPTLSVMSRLVDAGLLDWESPTDGEPGSRILPPEGLRIVVVSGEGATLKPSRLMYPLITALAARVPAVVVAEVRAPRGSVDAATGGDVPARGAFVDKLRSTEEIASRVITIDDLDEPFGRVALVLALAHGGDLTSGKFGIATSADAPFPPKAR